MARLRSSISQALYNVCFLSIANGQLDAFLTMASRAVEHSVRFALDDETTSAADLPQLTRSIMSPPSRRSGFVLIFQTGDCSSGYLRNCLAGENTIAQYSISLMETNSANQIDRKKSEATREFLLVVDLSSLSFPQWFYWK